MRYHRYAAQQPAGQRTAAGCGGDFREIYAELKKRGLSFMDAPVSGGEPMAVAGTLAIMAGGSEADFQRALSAAAIPASWPIRLSLPSILRPWPRG